MGSTAAATVWDHFFQAADSSVCDLLETETSGECQKRAEPEPGMHLWFEDRKVMRLARIKTGSGT